MTCAYGQHVWKLSKEEIKCKNCGVTIEKPNREHTSDLQYTKDEYDF